MGEETLGIRGKGGAGRTGAEEGGSQNFSAFWAAGTHWQRNGKYLCPCYRSAPPSGSTSACSASPRPISSLPGSSRRFPLPLLDPNLAPLLLNSVSTNQSQTPPSFFPNSTSGPSRQRSKRVLTVAAGARGSQRRPTAGLSLGDLGHGRAAGSAHPGWAPCALAGTCPSCGLSSTNEDRLGYLPPDNVQPRLQKKMAESLGREVTEAGMESCRPMKSSQRAGRLETSWFLCNPSALSLSLAHLGTPLSVPSTVFSGSTLITHTHQPPSLTTSVDHFLCSSHRTRCLSVFFISITTLWVCTAQIHSLIQCLLSICYMPRSVYALGTFF